MSIIHNALKKTQEQLKDKDKSKDPFFNPSGSGTPPGTPPTANDNNDKPNNPFILIFLIVLTIACLGAVGYYLLGDSSVINLTKSKTIVENTTAEGSSTDPSAAAKQINDLAAGINFQGTMTSGEGTAALINDDIYEEGDIVGGMTIKSIKKNKVKLELNSETVTLKIK